MADEIQIRLSMHVKKDNLEYQNYPTAFNTDMTTAKGPSPGAIRVPTSGVDVYFSELTTPAWVWLHNLDTTNYVEWGIKDPQTNVFYPVGELDPGESALFKFSRNLQEQYSGSGTGTTTPENYFRLKANVAACNVIVAAFEK